MKTYKFKTLVGFLRACSGQVTAEHVFSGRAYLNKGRGWCNVVLSDRARQDAVCALQEIISQIEDDSE